MGFIISFDDESIYGAINPRTTYEFCAKEEKSPFSADKGSSTDLENIGQDDGILLYEDIVDKVSIFENKKYLNVFCKQCEIIGEGHQSVETICVADFLEKIDCPGLVFFSTLYTEIIEKKLDVSFLKQIMTDDVLKFDFNINLKKLLMELVAIEDLKSYLKNDLNDLERDHWERMWVDNVKIKM